MAAGVEQIVSEARYRRIALADPEGQWELHHGRLRSKPPMTIEHNHLARLLGFRLQSQLDLKEHEVSVNLGRARRSSTQYYIPDVMVIPTEMVRSLQDYPGSLEVYTQALPLVIEVWSPSTGDYDIEEKLPEYQRRGDREIWRIHPYERTLIAWRRQPEGNYTETLYRGGVIRPVALPGVSIDLDALFKE